MDFYDIMYMFYSDGSFGYELISRLYSTTKKRAVALFLVVDKYYPITSFLNYCVFCLFTQQDKRDFAENRNIGNHQQGNNR